MGRLIERQESLRNRAIQARRRVNERETGKSQHPGAADGAERDRAAAEWHATPIAVALLFGFPESDSMTTLRARHSYFDLRTGDNWDLFFPGYFRPPDGRIDKRDLSAGRTSQADWRFDPVGFDLLRRHVEESSGGLWGFSGNTDLVIIGGCLVALGEPLIDWSSTLSLPLRMRGQNPIDIRWVRHRDHQP